MRTGCGAVLGLLAVAVVAGATIVGCATRGGTSARVDEPTTAQSRDHLPPPRVPEN